MEDYQQRVIEEAESLSEKIKKLDEFTSTETFAALHSEDSNLLLHQKFLMLDYYGVLNERISRFEASLRDGNGNLTGRIEKVTINVIQEDEH